MKDRADALLARGRLVRHHASVRELVANAPPWGERALQLVLLNSVLQFGALIVATRTSLTADRPAPPGYEVRMFSAAWMTLYLLCALVWWKPRPHARPTA